MDDAEKVNSEYIGCFIVMCKVLGADENTAKFTEIRNVALNEGLTEAMLKHIMEHFGHCAKHSKKKAKEMAGLLSENTMLPLVLPLLTGLVRGHKKSQALTLKLKVVPVLHAMENTSTTNAVGPLTESLLEALSKSNGRSVRR